MQEEYSDISDLNYLGLTVPVDGAVAVIADGCRTWAPVPGLEPDARGEGERWVPMCYEAVTTADGKIIDVVAWDDNDPSRWWLRTSRGVVLGAEELARVSWTDLPCIVVSTPAGWRFFDRKQTSAICFLDLSNTDIAEVFSTAWGEIAVPTQGLADRLHARQRECGGPDLPIVLDRGLA